MSITLAAAITIGAHLGSVHLPERAEQNNRNFGAYAREGAWTFGAYRNTIRRNSLYAAHSWQLGDLSLGVGAVSGYQRKCVRTAVALPALGSGWMRWDQSCTGASRGALAPMLLASYALPRSAIGTPRLTILPGIKGSANVLHLSLEW
jgi:hypothetical protein